MRRSIANKIFLAAMGLFLLATFIQWLLINHFFDALYLQSILTTMQKGLRVAVQGYEPGTGETLNPILDEYATETGSPVMVFTENYEIADRGILYRLQMARANADDGSYVHVPPGTYWHPARAWKPKWCGWAPPAITSLSR